MSTDTGGQQGRTAYVIVGGGLAAAKAIEGIRESDTDGVIVLVAEEDRLPYERPPLSKAVLKGEDEMETAFTHDRDWYFEQGVELRLGNPATSLDAEQHVADARRRRNPLLRKAPHRDGLLGSRARRAGRRPRRGALPARDAGVRGAQGALRPTGARIVIVGAGWIGLEVAAAARDAGCSGHRHRAAGRTAASRVMGEQVGGWFADLHRGHGVEFRFGEGVERIEGETSVTGVVTKSGDTVPADAVVVGVGITPNTGLAEGAGIDDRQRHRHRPRAAHLGRGRVGRR